MATQAKNRLAQLAKCGRCKSRLIAVQRKGESVHYICPKMQDRACEGCYISEEEFIKQLMMILKKRKIEIALEEK